jgi:hypothetical protein
LLFTLTGSGVSNLVMARSAIGFTVVVAVCELFAALGSLVVAETVAVLLMDAAAAAVGVTTRVNTPDAPLATLGLVQETVPFAPTAGVVHVQPATGDSETKLTPVGSTSPSETLAAAKGPLLVTVIVYVKLAPTLTDPAEASFVTIKSAAELTVVVVVAELLADVGSVSVAVTLAVLVRVPVAVGVTTMVIVALPPFTIPPRLHVTMPPDSVHTGPVGVTETKVTPVGSVSVSTTLVASAGPPLLTTNV